MKNRVIESKRQVFVVVRIDDFGEAAADPETLVSIVKVMDEQEFAEAERERLAELARGRGSSCRYVVHATRFVEPASVAE